MIELERIAFDIHNHRIWYEGSLIYMLAPNVRLPDRIELCVGDVIEAYDSKRWSERTVLRMWRSNDAHFVLILYDDMVKECEGIHHLASLAVMKCIAMKI